MKLCVATATHNFKWAKITHICLFWDQPFANLDVEALISFPITAIYATFKKSIFTHLKLCVATATHNFKWAKITHICLFWDQQFANLDVEALISFPITAI